MKVSKRDISIVMVLLGVIALFCVYQFNYQKAVEKAEKLQTEIDSKTRENNELLKINEQELNDKMTAWETNLVDMIQKYPARYRYDEMITYLMDLEEDEEKYGVHFTEYSMEPTNPLAAYTGKFRDKSVTFASIESQFKMKFFNNTYEGCKNMLRSIYAEGQKRLPKNFSKIELVYDNFTGIVDGEIELNAYSLSDYGQMGKATNWPQAEPIISPVPMGVECVFGVTVTPVPTVGEEEEVTPPEP